MLQAIYKPRASETLRNFIWLVFIVSRRGQKSGIITEDLCVAPKLTYYTICPT